MLVQKKFKAVCDKFFDMFESFDKKTYMRYSIRVI